MPVELTVNEQQIITGPKGLSFKYYKKEGGKTIKITGKEQEDGKFLLTVDGDKKTMSKKELIEYLEDNKELAFALASIKSQKGGKRKASRKGSKKGSRKGSRKGSKKGSPKGSKKVARGGSRRGSRKVNKY